MTLLANNKKAKFNYFILEEEEAGIVLLGTEVKSLRINKATIDESFLIHKHNEIWLHNANIAPYKFSTPDNNHSPKRDRKLLLKKKYIRKMLGKMKTKGISMVPLSLYFNSRGIVKVKIAVVKGKKLYDKRESIKNRDIEREIGRDFRGR